MIKQITYEKKNIKNTIPEALISTKEKHIIKEEPKQRMRRFGTRPKINISETEHADSAMLQTGHQYMNSPH